MVKAGGSSRVRRARRLRDSSARWRSPPAGGREPADHQYLACVDWGYPHGPARSTDRCQALCSCVASMLTTRFSRYVFSDFAAHICNILR